jgi:hypothetical protein
MMIGTRSGYFSRINCDFFTRSKVSFVANVAEGVYDATTFVETGGMVVVVVAYNV